jgi:hypothetical protein
MSKIYRPKVVRLMNQIHRKKEHLILMWVPGHAVIQGNEKADQHAEAALQGKLEWTSFDNLMVTVKPRIKKNNGAQELKRIDQVIISRLRMGYTRLTHGYRVDLNPSPECEDSGARLTVDHLLWDCPISEGKD